MTDLDQIALNNKDRPGWKLVTFGEVGLPVFDLQLAVTIQRAENVGVLHEFVLRLINLGLESPAEMAAFCGLDISQVHASLGTLLHEGEVKSGEGFDTYQLTKKGKSILSGFKKNQIRYEEVPTTIDGITRQLSNVQRQALWTEKELFSQGIPVLPPMPKRRPKVGEINVGDLNRQFRDRISNDLDKDSAKILRIDSLVGNIYTRYRKAVALAFKSNSGRKVVIGFAIDGYASSDHEREYNAAETGSKSPIFGVLYDPARRRRDILAAQRELNNYFPEIVGERSNLSEHSSFPGKPINSIHGYETKQVACYEHPGYLRNAMQAFRSRLIIVSPRIRAQVVDLTFLKTLESKLESGAEVYIISGHANSDQGATSEDVRVKAELENISKKYPNFLFLEQSAIQTKILLVDDSYVIATSFNWLSFKGNLNMCLKEDEGMYVAGSEYVDKYFNELINKFKN